MNERTRRRGPGVLGTANVILFGVLGLIWVWVPVGLLTGGIAALPALGSGILLLVAWFYLQRGINIASYWWSELVYAEGFQPPYVVPNPAPGFKGHVLTQWNHLKSWSFWRTALYHYLKVLYGLVVCTVCFLMFLAGIVLVAAQYSVGVSQQGLVFGFEIPELTTPGLRILFGIIAGLCILLPFAGLWFAGYGDRAIDRWLLPPTKAEVLRAETERLSAQTQRLSDEVTDLDAARAGAVESAAGERARIERDLHDGVQPMLVALSMKLGMAKNKLAAVPNDPEDPSAGSRPKDLEGARTLVAEAHSDSKAAITELRQLARGIHPAVLEDRGLDASVSALAARSVVPVDLRVDLPAGFRAGAEAESVAYFVIAESLTNINKHAHAAGAMVRVSLLPGAATPAGGAGAPSSRPAASAPGTLQVVISDNGRGGARVARDGSGTGLAGLADRVTAARGTFSLTSPVGGPTTIVVEVPCA
ncbi:ATP-binding protein [Brevibacterium moorei]|uniref:ATP-binding protein n=1 Tax=Brevibacterium moorei TaxID=2968457 RepID=UPI0027952CE8|nr:histidine kinase [Brevibacterium sp. 68QC2CO]